MPTAQQLKNSMYSLTQGFSQVSEAIRLCISLTINQNDRQLPCLVQNQMHGWFLANNNFPKGGPGQNARLQELPSMFLTF